MNITFKSTNFYSKELGEGLWAIICPELGELVRETKGDIVCTESEDFDEMFLNTPWEGIQSLDEIDLSEWEDVDLENLDSFNSDGIKEWIEMKLE